MAECHCCGDTATPTCGSCHTALYCGATCQSNHWQEEHSEWCFDKNDFKQVQSAIENHLDAIPIEDDVDDDFAAVGEALLEEDIEADPELMGTALEWIGIGALFKTDKTMEARGLKQQSKGIRKERRAQGRLNPKRLVLRAKETRMRGKAAMARKAAKKRGSKKKKGIFGKKR